MACRFAPAATVRDQRARNGKPKPYRRPATQPPHATMSDPAIHVEELTYAYAQGPLALDRVSFEVAAGECVGLVGPNGAGKTTLFLCLAGVYARRGGRVRVAGLDPADRGQRRLLPAHVGIIFQDS